MTGLKPPHFRADIPPWRGEWERVMHETVPVGRSRPERRGGSARRGKSESGATLVETAFAVMLFLMLLFGIISLCLTAYNRAALRQALHASSRLCASGGTIGSLSRVDSVESVLRTEGGRLGLGLRLRDIKICPTATPACAADDAGGPGQLVTITGIMESQILLNTKTFEIDERITFKNEQF